MGLAALGVRSVYVASDVSSVPAESKAARQGLIERAGAEGSSPGFPSPESLSPGSVSPGAAAEAAPALLTAARSSPKVPFPISLPLPATGFQLNPAQVSSRQAASLVTPGGYQPAES